jgi:hypothetical protein
MSSLPAKIAQRPPKSPQQVEGDLIGLLKGVKELNKAQLKTAIKEMQRLDYTPVSEIQLNQFVDKVFQNSLDQDSPYPTTAEAENEERITVA